MHPQATPARIRIFHDQTVISIPELATELLVVLRPEPGWIFTFRLCGMLATTASGFLLYRLHQERINAAVINTLPETDLVIGIQLAPVMN